MAGAFAVYWLVLGLFFTLGSEYLGDSMTTIEYPDTETYTLNSSNNTAIAQIEINQLNAFEQIIDTGGFVFFGIGLPSDTPEWFKIIFAFIQSGITILAVLLITDAIHTG